MTRSPSPAKPAKARCCWSPALIALLLVLAAQQCSAAYYGKLIGKLSQLHHGVSGEVYAVDARTLFIKDFTYDGEGPAAFFYAGTTKTVGQNGFKVRDERGTMNVLKRYRKKDITLTLPEGKTLNNVKWFSVYCDEYAVNFGDVKIPRNFDYPRPQKLGSLSGIHGVGSEPVVVVDAQTLLVPSFSYDGEAPDAKFWVGSGPSPSPQGIRVPDENGKEVPLRKYDRKTIVLTLPADLTVHQLGHFGVWCEAFAVDFGHVQIPQSLNVPPSLKMLGVSPQNLRGGQGQGSLTPAHTHNIQEISQLAALAQSNAVQQQQQQQQQQLHLQLQQQQQQQQQYQSPTTYRPSLQRREEPNVQIVQALDYHVPLLAADGIVARLHQLRANVQDDGELLGYAAVSQATPAQRRSDASAALHTRTQQAIQPLQAHARFQYQGHQGPRNLESYHVQY